MPLSDLQHEPVASLLAASLTRVTFMDLPPDLVNPATAVFEQLVASANPDQPPHKRTMLTAGALTMAAATRAVADVVPQPSTALTAGIAASAAYHRAHLLDTSTALRARKTPAGWTVGAELVMFYLHALDIVTGEVTRTKVPTGSVSIPAPPAGSRTPALPVG